MNHRNNRGGSGLDRAELMSFLLGELDEAETTRIEGIFLSESSDAAKEELAEAKKALQANYDKGQLDAKRKQAYERRFLVEAAAVEQQLALDALPKMPEPATEQQRAGTAPPPSTAPDASKPKGVKRLGSWLGGLFSK